MNQAETTVLHAGYGCLVMNIAAKTVRDIYHSYKKYSCNKNK
jgi:hypothetical protein